MWRERGDLEGLSAGSAVEPAAHVVSLARELEELIAALDRRVPRVEQAGEADIARAAAALRAKAVERLAELTRTGPPDTPETDRPT